MREGVPSGTSFLVAFSRGLGVDDHELDPVAADLLPPWMARLVTLPRSLGSASHAYRWSIRGATFGLIDHNVLRTEAIDAHLLDALRSGVSQLVILGAGLDARAWRLRALRDTTVFEVDHPATQRYKLDRIAGRTPPTDIRYVAVDFESESFSERLQSVGFRANEPSVWIWEGVAMYLPLEAVNDTLRQVTSLSEEGSTLVMTYRVADGLPLGALGRALIPAFFAAAGEPLKCTLDPSQLASALTPEWELTFDQDGRGWRALSRSTAIAPFTFRSERLAVAVRRR